VIVMMISYFHKMGYFALATTILLIIVTCSASPVPTQVLKEYSNPSSLTHPVNYLVNNGYEEWKDIVNVVEKHRAKRSPIPLLSIKLNLLNKKSLKLKPLEIKVEKKTKPKLTPKIVKGTPKLLISGPKVAGPPALLGAKLLGPTLPLGAKLLVPKVGLAGLTKLTLASAPLILPVKKPLSLKAAPKLVLAGPKVAGPLTLGAATLPAGAKVVKTAPLLAPAVLKKGPLAASPLLLPLAGKAAKAKKLAIPAVLLKSQSQGGSSQRRGSSSRSGSNRTRGCNRNGFSHSRNSNRGHQTGRGHEDGSSCAGEEDTRPAEDEVTTRAPTEEEKEAALEAKAALEEARNTINQAQAAMEEALAAMRAAQLSSLSSLNLGR